MPRVNREFRTLTGPANTAVMGSSMGGLLSFYLVTHHPDVFGACGCLSTHFPEMPGIAFYGTRDDNSRAKDLLLTRAATAARYAQPSGHSGRLSQRGPYQSRCGAASRLIR